MPIEIDKTETTTSIEMNITGINNNIEQQAATIIYRIDYKNNGITVRSASKRIPCIGEDWLNIAQTVTSGGVLYEETRTPIVAFIVANDPELAGV